ncbi:hypothetical protein FRC07_011625 [Ceratobasidium sp. 392]|nr:hypothetical protein FRC07_011625 [Ceratobasidium sp. 392]
MSRGRLTKGGAADLPAAGRSVLHDWNTGKIPYYSVPPAVHPSSRPSAPTDANNPTGAENVGEAKIVSQLGEAFDIDALFRDADAAVLDGVDAEMEEARPDDDGEMEDDSNLMQSDDLAPSIPVKRRRSQSPSNSQVDTSLAAFPFSTLPSLDSELPPPKRTRVGDDEGDLEMDQAAAAAPSVRPMSRKALRKSGLIGTGASARRRKAERMAVD